MSEEYFYHVQAFEHIKVNGKIIKTGEVEQVLIKATSSREAIRRVANGFKEDGTYTGLQTWLAPRVSHKKALELANWDCRVWCDI